MIERLVVLSASRLQASPFRRPSRLVGAGTQANGSLATMLVKSNWRLAIGGWPCCGFGRAHRPARPPVDLPGEAQRCSVVSAVNHDSYLASTARASAPLASLQAWRPFMGGAERAGRCNWAAQHCCWAAMSSCCLCCQSGSQNLEQAFFHLHWRHHCSRPSIP